MRKEQLLGDFIYVIHKFLMRDESQAKGRVP